jgi:hypothetical protein
MGTIQMLPPQPPDPTLHFDLFQFDKRRMAVTIKSRITFSDLEHMHVESRAAQRPNRWIPVFAANDKQLKHVLAVSAWRYANGGKMPMPENLSLDTLKRITARAFQQKMTRSLVNMTEAQRDMLRRHVRSVDGAGGYLPFKAALVYKSWRQGLPSTQVAEQLWMTPPNVRIILYRLCNIARSLGYETFPRGKSLGKNTGRMRHMTKLPDGPTLIKFYESSDYWTFARLGKRFGVVRGSVMKAYRDAKRKADPDYVGLRLGRRRCELRGKRGWVTLRHIGAPPKREARPR